MESQVDDLIAECHLIAKRGYRALVTTLTKKMAEDLTEYMHDQGIRVRYMHSAMSKPWSASRSSAIFVWAPLMC